MKRLLVELVTIGNRLVLAPADSLAEEDLAGIDRNKLHMVTLTAARKPGPLRKWWAGLSVLLDNLPEPLAERFPTTRKLHNLFLNELGYIEKAYRLDGTFIPIPDSIALDAMTDAEFEALFEKARVLCLEAFGWDPWQVWEDERPKRNIQTQRR